MSTQELFWFSPFNSFTPCSLSYKLGGKQVKASEEETFTSICAPQFFKATKAIENGCNYNIVLLQKWDESKCICFHFHSLVLDCSSSYKNLPLRRALSLAVSCLCNIKTIMEYDAYVVFVTCKQSSNTMALPYTSLFFYIKMPLKIKRKGLWPIFAAFSVYLWSHHASFCFLSKANRFLTVASVWDSHTDLHRDSLLKPFVTHEKSGICYATLVRWSELIRLLTFVMNGIWSLTNSSFTWQVWILFSWDRSSF